MLEIMLALALVCAMPALAQAKSFKLGDEDGVTWIDIPDTWEPTTFDDGVAGTSPDKETYVAAEIVKADALDDAGKDADKFFAEQKVKVKDETKKEKTTTVNGLPAYDISWDATDEDGPTHVSLTLIKMENSKVLLLTYWGSPAGETSNGKDLKAIAESIKPIK